MTKNDAGLLSALGASFQRDLLLAFRHRQDMVNPLVFFVMAVALFPLGVSPDPVFLAAAGGGLIWVAALLATLLSLDGLFRSDHEDGSLEQWLLVPQPLFLMVTLRVFVHWLVTGLPLILLTPLLAVMVHVPDEQIGLLCLSLLLGTPVLSLVGAIGAALTVGLKSGGVLISLLILPFYIPVLIFGTGTLGAAALGVPVGSYLALLGAMLALALTLAPLAIAAALRISVANGQ